MRAKVGCLMLLATILVGSSCAPVENKPNVVVKDGPPPPPLDLPKEMKQRLEKTLEHVHARDLESDFSFWTIFHGILGMGFDTTLLDRETKKKVVAIDWIAEGKPLRGLKFEVHAEGLDVRIGPIGDGQGHQDQFVAEMAQWGMPADKVFIVDGKEYTFLDFARYSRFRASATKEQELGWAILVIPQYFGVDVRPWTNKFGETVSLEDLLRAELKIDMTKAACGGTHSLFGLTWVYHLHLQRHDKLAKTGVWADVHKHLEQYKELARKHQNPDGSFSTEYITAPGDVKDPNRRINTTGHVVEWLALYLPDDELRAQWVQDAVMALCKMILDRAHTPIDTGSLYHATHGLHIYYDRVFDVPNSKKGQTVIPLPPR